MSYKLLPGLYRHWQGGIYNVLATVRHSETDEIMVHYEAVRPNKKARKRNPSGMAFVQPIARFKGNVPYEDADVPQFRRMPDQPSNVGSGHAARCLTKHANK